MHRADRSPLLRSFERHLRAANRAESTVASYLVRLRQAEAFLAACDVHLVDAQRADLEAFLGDLVAHRKPATAATRYKVLRLFYQWLEEESEITSNPTAKLAGRNGGRPARGHATRGEEPLIDRAPRLERSATHAVASPREDEARRRPENG